MRVVHAVCVYAGNMYMWFVCVCARSRSNEVTPTQHEVLVLLVQLRSRGAGALHPLKNLCFHLSWSFVALQEFLIKYPETALWYKAETGTALS